MACIAFLSVAPRWIAVQRYGRAAILLALACAPFPIFAVDTPTAWQLIDDGDAPTAGGGRPFAFDTARQRAVLLNPADGPFVSTTWELAGEDWIRRFLPEPTPVGNGCATFDEGRGVTVHFGGGLPGASHINETWEYDGAQWVERQLATNPPARASCGLTYDSVRQVVVLFGGWASPGVLQPLNDTWEYNGTNWNQVQTRDSPSPRARVAMTFDRNQGATVLFGGTPGFSAVLADTWEYNGNNWRKKNTQSSPSARHAAGMAYDRTRLRTVLFGGVASGVGDFGDTWEYNGTTWIQMSPVQSPRPRNDFRMDYDTARAKVIGFGGDASDDDDFNDTWTYDGTTWTQVALSGLPSARSGFGMAYDPLLDAVVLYGGREAGFDWPTTAVFDTWHFDGSTWTKQDSAGAPTASTSVLLAFDANRAGLVSFSGQNQTAALVADLHEYVGDPRQWVSSPTFSLDPRQGYGWTAAPSLGGTLLFGGWACCTFEGFHYAANDTWVLSGNLWEQKFPPTSPAGRRAHALTFDIESGRGILYAGELQTGADLADTWIYDGNDWQLVMASSPPGQRTGHSMAYDAARDRIVLYGDASTPEGVTWEFDGTQWLARPTPFQPGPDRCNNPIAYDAKREVIFLFGGDACQAGFWYNDTWAYGPDPDGDGIVGGLDNCRNVANANQANTDGDPAGDACDCAAADPTVFAVPAEVTGLTFASDHVTLSWDSAAPGAGSATVHDVVRGALNELPVGSGPQETCLAPGISASSTTDTAVPTSGTGFWYLARGRNVCGAGTYGTQSGGPERTTNACP